MKKVHPGTSAFQPFPAATQAAGCLALLVFAASAIARDGQSPDPLCDFPSSTGGGSNDDFGRSLAAIEGQVAIGSPQRPGTSGGATVQNKGAVLLYRELPDATFIWDALLEDPRGKASDLLGIAVGMTPQWLAAGAPGIDRVVEGLPLPNQLQCGGVCLFEYSGGTWANPVRVYHPESRSNDLFGSTLSLLQETNSDGSHRNTLAVGAPTDDVPIPTGGSRVDAGSVTIFELDGSGWQQTAIIAMPILSGDTAASTAGAVFGTSLKLEGNHLFVGAKRASPSVLNQGAVYVFRRNTIDEPAPTVLQQDPAWGEWALVQRIVTSVPGSNDQFGTSLDASHDTLVVGAPNRQMGSMTNVGAAYVYERDAKLGTYSWSSSLIPSGAQSNDYFGMAVGVLPHRVMVGAPGVDIGAAGPDQIVNMGMCYLFASDDFECDGWLQRTKYLPPEYARVSGAGFGSVLLIQDNSIEIAAPDAPNTGGLTQGAVFAYELDVLGCPWDLTGDGVVAGEDIGLFVSHWGGTLPPSWVADFNGDGIVNGEDLTYVLAHWGFCTCDPNGGDPPP